VLAVELAKVENLVKFIDKIRKDQEEVAAQWVQADPILNAIYSAKSPLSMREIRVLATTTSPIRQAHVEHWVKLGVIIFHPAVEGSEIMAHGRYSKGKPLQVDIPEMTADTATPEMFKKILPTTTPTERNAAVDLDPEVAT
jgi:hypothetical protein